MSLPKGSDEKMSLEGVTNTQYTGENRCWPCTIVNLAIALVLTAIVSRKSKVTAGVVFAGSIGIISLRGYLVPGTPTLTKRYLPPRVLELFGKDPTPEYDSGLGEGITFDESTQSTLSDTESTTEDDADHDLDVEAYLLEYEIVEPCAEIDDLCLTDSFEAQWNAEIAGLDAEALDATDAATVFGIETEDDLEIVEFDEARVMNHGDSQVGKWPSHAALVADITAARVLERIDPRWDQYEPEQIGQVLTTLRLFLETCPTGGGPVSMGEETVESCCTSHEIVAVTCEETGERLFEHPVEELAT